MGYPLRQETREAISKAQEPTNLSAEQKERNEIQLANWLIKSGNPRLMRQGRRRLWRIRLRRLKAEEITELGAYLLANRRREFVQRIKEKRNND